MKHPAAAAAAALLLLVGSRLAAAQPRTGGECVTYPDTGLYCSSLGLGGESVFLYDGEDLEAMSSECQVALSTIKAAANGARGSPECVYNYERAACLTWFPLCDASTQLPRRPCASLCENITTDLCLNIVQLSAQTSLKDDVFRCDDTIGDPTRGRTGFYRYYPEGWDGEAAFVPDTYTETAFPPPAELQCVGMSADAEIPCKPLQCRQPYVERRFPQVKDKGTMAPDYVNAEDFRECFESSGSDAMENCTQCFSSCFMPCPLPTAYTDTEYTVMWVLNWLPGVLSFPLSLAVFVSEASKFIAIRRRKRNIADVLILLSSMFCILLFALDAFPSMILREDMACAGYDHVSEYANLEGSAICTVGKIRPHVLQALLATVACTLHNVWQKLRASLAMSKYTVSPLSRFAFGLSIFGIPVVLAVLTFALEADLLFQFSTQYRRSKGGDLDVGFLYIPNLLRYAFSCGPKFSTIPEETLIVHVPMLLIGFVCVGYSFLVMMLVRVLGGQGASGSAAMDGKRKKDQAIYQLAKRMLMFAGACTFLVMLNFLSSLLFLPRAVEFGLQTRRWDSCIKSGINFNTRENIRDPTDLSLEAALSHCGSLGDFAPSAFLLYLITLTQSLPPLAFGFVFAQPAVARLLNPKASRVAAGTYRTSVASATNNESEGESPLAAGE